MVEMMKGPKLLEDSNDDEDDGDIGGGQCDDWQPCHSALVRPIHVGPTITAASGNQSGGSKGV